jgi:NAD(P)-dependent dehydrogenase (short-subunit alcohol dehydrogenase family)
VIHRKSNIMAPKYTNKLQGKRVLVLGGTSGIGFCVAEACVEFGAIVTVASSREEKVNKTIERLTTSYPEAKDRISGHSCDLASPDVEANLTTLFEFATKDGKLDHVVNTAGDSFGLIALKDATAEKIQKMGTVRFMGMLLMAKLCPQYMHQTSESSITSTGGVASAKPSAGWSAMAGWGAGKEGMTRGLAVDLKPIRVNCVAPGAILTELWDSFSGGNVQAIVDMYKSKTLLDKIGMPEDTAEAYLYMMRDTFITGTTLYTEGGYLLI